MAGCLFAEAVASCRAAGVLHRLPNIPPRLEITIPTTRRVVLKGFEVHHSSGLEVVDLSHRSGIPVTSLARTTVDLALLDIRMGRTVATHLLARRKLPLSLLVDRLEAVGINGRRGARDVMNMLEELGGRKRHADSEMQHRFEQIAIEGYKAGLLPEPQLEYAVLMSDRRWRYPDVAFPHIRLGFEYQSFIHHSQLDDFAADQARNLALFGEGWIIVPITAVEVRRPLRLVEVMARIIAAAEARGRR